MDGVSVLVGVTVFVGVLVGVLVGLGVLVCVLVGLGVLVGVTDKDIDIVGVTVGVVVLVGVTLGVVVLVGVMLGVTVLVGVVVGVGCGDGVRTTTGSLSGLNGSINPYLVFNILKLCLICPAFNGSTYILKALKSPTKLPPNSFSRIMFVVNPEYDVLFNISVGNSSGSCIKLLLFVVNICISSLSVHELNVKESFNPCVPPPMEILKGTPICLSLRVFNGLGIISSKSSTIKNIFPFI